MHFIILGVAETHRAYFFRTKLFSTTLPETLVMPVKQTDLAEKIILISNWTLCG